MHTAPYHVKLPSQLHAGFDHCQLHWRVMVQLNVSEFLNIKGLNHNKQQQIESRISPLANHSLRKVAQNKTLVLLHVLYTTCLHLHDPEKTYHTFAHQHARKELGCQAKTVVLLPHPAGHGHGSHAPTLRWTGWLGCLTWWSIKSDFIKIRIHPVTIFDSITAWNDIKHWHGIRRFHGMVWNWCVCVWINDINAFTRLYRQYSLITHNTW